MAVRAGVQLGVSVASSMSHFFSRENRARRLLRGGEGGGSARCVRYELDVVELDLVTEVHLGILRGELAVTRKIRARPRRLRRLFFFFFLLKNLLRDTFDSFVT